MADALRLTKNERQQRLQDMLSADPLLTDDMLAQKLGVSVQTIRLDRLELGVPEMRTRAKQLIEMMQSRVRALSLVEVVGELVDLELGHSGISILETTKEMSFERTDIVRGHYLFAQGNSLAIAATDAETAVTGSARLRFHHPVRVGDRVLAKARIKQSKASKSLVTIESKVDAKTVFSGSFVIFALDRDGNGPPEGDIH